MRAWLLLILFLVLPATRAQEVALRQGALRGERVHSVVRFLGIPYARPPLGERRWQAPAPVPAGSGVIDARGFSAACLQPASRFVAAPAGFSEDCLTLNVWTPSLDGELPVMVWLHGGGFRTGSNVFPGEVLAEQGVVVVSPNYRLGPLGFFFHDALDSRVANYGLLDMELALRWVQDNIARLGGDRERVTVFGVSAGGQAVNLLMSSPRTAGLFQRAIAQSGYGTWALPRTATAPAPAPRAMDGSPARSAEALAAAVVARVAAGADSAAALRALDGQRLVEALDGFQLPIVDGTSLPEEPGIRFLRGEQRDVPLLTGGNSYEGSVMPAAAIPTREFRGYLGERVAQLRVLYRDDDGSRWLRRAFGDYRYLLSARVLGDAMATVSSASWSYYVDFVADADPGNPGTAHGMDAAYLLRGHASENPAVRALTGTLRGYWLNFARHGDPNGPGLPRWPARDAENRHWQRFTEPGGETRERRLAAKLALLEHLYRRRVDGAGALPGAPARRAGPQPAPQRVRQSR